jgi:hypothetical protein
MPVRFGAEFRVSPRNLGLPEEQKIYRQFLPEIFMSSLMLFDSRQEMGDTIPISENRVMSLHFHLSLRNDYFHE